MSRTALTLFGLATAGYGAALMQRPERLSNPIGREMSAPMARLGRGIGIRDLASGLAIVFAAPGRARAIAVAARIAFDGADVLFLAPIAAPERRPLARGVAAGWGGLAALLWLRERK